ncbi:MAG: electron transport complex subunit RsxG [Pseudomonadales bacterium]
MTDNSEHQDQQNNSDDKPSSLGLSISTNSAILGFFALLCTAIIASTYLGTEEQIDKQKRQAQLKALYQIVPKQQHDNDMLQDNIIFEDQALGHRKEQTLFLAKKALSGQQQPLTLIYPVTARDGYSGDIDFIIGINVSDGSIAGVRVIKHKETPGLGDKVDLRKSEWVLDFNGHSLGDPDSEGWTVKKEGGIFDGFTGATITPRAVIASIENTLRYHHLNVDRLIEQFDVKKEQ